MFAQGVVAVASEQLKVRTRLLFTDAAHADPVLHDKDAEFEVDSPLRYESMPGLFGLLFDLPDAVSGQSSRANGGDGAGRVEPWTRLCAILSLG